MTLDPDSRIGFLQSMGGVTLAGLTELFLRVDALRRLIGLGLGGCGRRSRRAAAEQRRTQTENRAKISSGHSISYSRSGEGATAAKFWPLRSIAVTR
jgi:hypothetical protein